MSKEPELLTEAEMLALVKAQAAEKGIRGLARELNLTPGALQGVTSGRHGVGRSVPAAMGYEVRYLKTP